MKRTIFIALLFIAFETVHGQIVEMDGKRFNCDSAYTNYEMGRCSKYLLDQSVKEYTKTSVMVCNCLDTLMKNDKIERTKLLKENPSQQFDFWTDYSKIKKLFLESNKLFEEHAKLEYAIEGEFYGPGRERVVGENMRLKQLYDNRIKELKNIIQLHCN